MADIFLQIISGIQVGRKIRVGNGLTIGRHPENIICFSGPDGTLVSGKHAVIEKRDEILYLRDLGSTNGTFINGEQIFEHPLTTDEVIGLGLSGPKLRVMHGLTAGIASLGSPALPSASAMTVASQSPIGNGQGTTPGDFGHTGEDAGNYTIGLAHRLKVDEAGHEEMRDLIRDKARADRIVQSGLLSKRDAMMLHSAASTFSSHKQRAWWILGSVSGVAVVVVGLLLYQNMGYRGKVKQQENLLFTARTLEFQLAEAKQAGPAESEEEKALLVAKLRAAERQLMKVRSDLKFSDKVSTYKDPLGHEIQTILEGFGKRDYIVPDIFIKQVQKHIYTFTRTSSRAIIERSFANSHKYKKLIEGELARQGMPMAFFYLSMHESLLDSAIISKAGARGLWQFMPQTAREYGLRVPNNWEDRPSIEDQRTNPRLATQAGVKYVKTLYAEFGDVALAMAAYNAGEGRIRKELRSIDDPINNRDFWYIYRLGTLAEETNEYVPKIIATMIIDKNHSRYGFEE